MGNFPIIGLTIAVVMMIVGFIIYKKGNEKFVNGANPFTNEQTNATYEKMRCIPKKPIAYYEVTSEMMGLPYINQFDRPGPDYDYQTVPEQQNDTNVFPGIPLSNLYTSPDRFNATPYFE